MRHHVVRSASIRIHTYQILLATGYWLLFSPFKMRLLPKRRPPTATARLPEEEGKLTCTPPLKNAASLGVNARMRSLGRVAPPCQTRLDR